MVEAGGPFITCDKEYDLRNDDDLRQFQAQCFIAGTDWRNIRRRGRVVKRPAKNPEHTAAMIQLEQALDQCSSLRAVVRRLTAARVARPAFRGRGGDTSVWSIQTIRYLLKNPIYTGTFVFGRFGGTRGRSRVWQRFATDQDGAVREFVHYVPELSYWGLLHR